MVSLSPTVHVAGKDLQSRILFPLIVLLLLEQIFLFFYDPSRCSQWLFLPWHGVIESTHKFSGRRLGAHRLVGLCQFLRHGWHYHALLQLCRSLLKWVLQWTQLLHLIWWIHRVLKHHLLLVWLAAVLRGGKGTWWADTTVDVISMRVTRGDSGKLVARAQSQSWTTVGLNLLVKHDKFIVNLGSGVDGWQT